MAQPAFSSTPFSLTQSATPTTILGTSEVPVSGNLVAIEIETASTGAHLWAFDSVTGSTFPTLRSNSADQTLAHGVRLNYDAPFTSGLSVMATGTVTGRVIAQVP